MSMQTDGEINIKFGEERVVFTLLVHLQWKTLVKVDLCAIHEDFYWISKNLFNFFSILTHFRYWPQGQELQDRSDKLTGKIIISIIGRLKDLNGKGF